MYLPSSATNSPLPEATVIATGPGAPDKTGTVRPTIVQAGDRVLLPGWGGNPIKVGDEVSLRLRVPWPGWTQADVGVVCVGVLLVPRLGDPREDSGVSEWVRDACDVDV